MALVKQLEVPTFFMRFENKIILIISKPRCLIFLVENIEKMPYQETCEVLNKNTVVVTKHFQYRVDLFFKVIVLNWLLGKTHY